MPVLKSTADLLRLSEETRQSLKETSAQATEIMVGMGTCGLAAGAGEVYQALQKELEKRNLQVTLRAVGCIGMCVQEPLVDVQLAGQPRVTYTHVKPAQVARIVEEHVQQGRVIEEWAIGYVPPDW